jgi:hypothetical protein
MEKRCIRLFAPTVERNVKFRSNQMEADQSTVENVTLSEDRHEDIKPTS